MDGLSKLWLRCCKGQTLSEEPTTFGNFPGVVREMTEETWKLICPEVSLDLCIWLECIWPASSLSWYVNWDSPIWELHFILNYLNQCDVLIFSWAQQCCVGRADAGGRYPGRLGERPGLYFKRGILHIPGSPEGGVREPGSEKGKWDNSKSRLDQPQVLPRGLVAAAGDMPWEFIPEAGARIFQIGTVPVRTDIPLLQIAFFKIT